MGMSDFTVVECQHPVDQAYVSKTDGKVYCRGMEPEIHERPGGFVRLSDDRDALRVAFEEFYMARERNEQARA